MNNFVVLVNYSADNEKLFVQFKDKVENILKPLFEVNLLILDHTLQKEKEIKKHKYNIYIEIEPQKEYKAYVKLSRFLMLYYIKEKKVKIPRWFYWALFYYIISNIYESEIIQIRNFTYLILKSNIGRMIFCNSIVVNKKYLGFIAVYYLNQYSISEMNKIIMNSEYCKIKKMIIDSWLGFIDFLSYRII